MLHTTLLQYDGTIVWMSASPGPPIEKVIGTKLWHWAEQRERAAWRSYLAEAVQDGKSGPHLTRFGGRKWRCQFENLRAASLVVNRWGAHFPEDLSDRELEVLELIAQDNKPQSVARRLKLALSTVETYRARLKLKLKVEGTAGLTQWAIRVGLVRLPALLLFLG